MKLFPVLLDLSGKEVLVIGSTDEAVRIVRLLSGCTPSLSVLSSLPPSELSSFCKEHRIRLMEKEYSREDLYGSDLVFLASSSEEVTKDASAICRTMGIRLYVSGSPGRSDFLLPQEKGCS